MTKVLFISWRLPVIFISQLSVTDITLIFSFDPFTCLFTDGCRADNSDNNEKFEDVDMNVFIQVQKLKSYNKIYTSFL